MLWRTGTRREERDQSDHPNGSRHFHNRHKMQVEIENIPSTPEKTNSFSMLGSFARSNDIGYTYPACGLI